MDIVFALGDKECRVRIGIAAQAALQGRDRPLVAEITVTLACCIRKSVYFRDAEYGEKLLLVTPQLAVALVSAEHRAHEADIDSRLPPIKNWSAIAPRWLTIDFHDGQWVGDFGYSRSAERT